MHTIILTNRSNSTLREAVYFYTDTLLNQDYLHLYENGRLFKYNKLA